MRRKLRFYTINIILAVLIIGIFSYIGVSMFCSVHKVTVKGSTIYSKDEIKSFILDDKKSKSNTVYAVLYNKVKPKKDIPFEDHYKVSLTRYDRIKITVYEKPCVGYIPLKKGGYAYFDEDGTVVEVSERVVESAIGVIGISVKKAQVGEKVALKKSQLDFIVQVLKNLRKYDMAITTLSFDEAGNATAVYGNQLIVVGKSDFLEEKMMRLPHILPKIEGQAGTLHLENWTDENTDIVFEKAKP